MSTTYKTVLSALCMAVGIALPFMTGQIPLIGNMLLPMHIPVFVCAFCCGARYGVLVGIVTPLLRSLIFQAPVLYPRAVIMALELASYALVAGVLYHVFDKRRVWSIYASMVPAMLIGRVVWGLSKWILLGFTEEPFTWWLFFSEGFVTAVPGIVLQLIVVPVMVMLIQNEHLQRRSTRSGRRSAR